MTLFALAGYPYSEVEPDRDREIADYYFHIPPRQPGARLSRFAASTLRSTIHCLTILTICDQISIGAIFQRQWGKSEAIS